MRELVALTTVMVIVTAGMVSAQEQQQPANINPQLVTVNGEPVFASDVSIVLQNMVAQATRTGPGQPDTESMVPIAVKRVVETKLLAQEARRRDLQPNAKRVDRMLQSIEQNAGSRAALEQSLTQAGTDYQRLRKGFEEMDLISEMINADLRPQISTTEQEIKQFYEDNPELFTSPEQIKARHILFRSPPTAPEAEAAKARAKAEQALKRVLAGEDFAAVAKEVSEGPSASRGGDLGFFSANMMAPKFAEAAFAVPVGEISEVVQTGFGFHVIKVEEHHAGGVLQPLDQVRENIIKAIKQYKTTEQVAALLRQLLDKAEIVPAPGSDLPPGLFEEPSPMVAPQ